MTDFSWWSFFPPLSDSLLMCLAITVAYVIFGIAGFGTALVASPVLALFIPVAKIVPLLALLDFSAAIAKVARDRSQADGAELKRLLPLMIAGSLLGAAVLLFSQPDFLLLLLGLFVIGYALYALIGNPRPHRFSPRFAVPFGLVGGVFSALFGSGGFIYAIYLAGRIEAKEKIQVTQSTLIGFSTLTRLLLFLVAGVYADWSLLFLAALFTPAMWLGLFIGRRITLHLSRSTFLRIVNVLVLGSGVFLLIRYYALV